MPAIKVRLPNADLAHYGPETPSLAAKKRLASLLSCPDTLPQLVPLAAGIPGQSVTIWLSAEQEAQLQAMAEQHSLAGAGPAASALLHAWALAKRQAERPEPESAQTDDRWPMLDRINTALGNTTRPDQGRFFAGIMTELLQCDIAHRVLFAEASTGVGKTRAYLAAALAWLEHHPDQAVVVAAPSYNVLLQTVVQWQRIEDALPLPPWAVIAGQGEFVSADALRALLAEHPELPGAEQAQAWADNGGQPAADDPIGHRWLVRSLLAATHGEWTNVGDVLLHPDTSQDDAGMQAYRHQFTGHGDARLVFCTHAMLAVEIRARLRQAMLRHEEATGERASETAFETWQARSEEERKQSLAFHLRNTLLGLSSLDEDGRLPPISLLIVDEAHLLEQAVAQVFASGLSLLRLNQVMRELHERLPKMVTATDLATIKELRQTLKEIGQAMNGEPVDAYEHPAAAQAVAQLHQLLGRIAKKAQGRTKDRSLLRLIREGSLALDVAARAGTERSGMQVRLSWSPVLFWPMVNVGRFDVSGELDFLWNVVVNQASVLVSATLYEDVSMQGLENMRRVLSVRSNLARPLVPVRPQWLFSPVTLHLVSDTVHADGLPRFRRPAQRDNLDQVDTDERLERWRSDVAGYVQMAHHSAAGGVLVLMTAHAERELLAERLRDALPDQCLLSQAEGQSLEAVRHRFLELTAQGIRPCLIGVGGAWTGLDLSGDGLAALTGTPVPAGQDNVLTDLIIPIAPIGLNRSITHEWRRRRTGMVAEIAATSMMMRQGLGRLVRQEGLPDNRRLHFLDARIHDSAWNSLFNPIRKALSDYQRRVAI